MALNYAQARIMMASELARMSLDELKQALLNGGHYPHDLVVAALRAALEECAAELQQTQSCADAPEQQPPVSVRGGRHTRTGLEP